MELDLKEVNKLGLRSCNTQINEKAPNFIKIYTNNVGFGATNWDTSLIFGEIVGLNENGEPIVEQKVKVNMTREFMKALSNLLAINVKAYEEKFGEISLEKLLQVTNDIETENKIKRVVSKKPARKTTTKKR